MRFTSAVVGGIRVFAVTGTNTVSFGIHANAASRAGLLGFAVERIDPTEDERFFMTGFKVFPSVVPSPDASTVVSTFEHPIQSLVWDDFTGKPGRPYTYRFHPLAGDSEEPRPIPAGGRDRRRDRAAPRRHARRVLQSRRRLEPAVRTAIRQPPARPAADRAEAEGGPRVAQPRPRRGDARASSGPPVRAMRSADASTSSPTGRCSMSSRRPSTRAWT